MYLTKSDAVESAAALRIRRLLQFLRCEECGLEFEIVTNWYAERILERGLPTCCGYTMTLLTRRKG